ncbi:XRE family transcriptional regulator [Fimbriimonas ginsengisoli]|nr:XRE family transcriptional regulator [Fimbriimonas ginsengisoli]
MNRSDPAVFGRNARAFRTLRGWSIRDFSERAGLSTKTIVKVESGNACTVKTERKIADGLNVYIGRLWDPDLLAQAPQRVIRSDAGRWFFAIGDDAAAHHARVSRAQVGEEGERMRADPEEIQETAERHRLGRAGLARVFVKTCGGGISSGFFQFNEVELFGLDETPADGSNFPYMLICRTGGLRMHIRGETYELNAGESMVFDGNDPYSVEPLAKDGSICPPATFYFLCLRLLRV